MDLATDSLGKVVNGRFDPSGQETMKGAACNGGISEASLETSGGKNAYQAEHLHRVKRDIEGSREGRLGAGCHLVVTNVRVVAGLNGQDGASGGQVSSLRD